MLRRDEPSGLSCIHYTIPHLVSLLSSVAKKPEEKDRGIPLAPGSKVKEWKIKVNEEKGWVKIGRNKSSIAKLEKHYGKKVCAPMAVCRFKGKNAAACCPHWGQPGHSHGSSLHTIDSKKHDEVQKNFAKFRWRADGEGDDAGNV